MSYKTPCGRMTAEGERQVERARLFAEGFLTYAGESELCGEPYEVSDWLMKNICVPSSGLAPSTSAPAGSAAASAASSSASTEASASRSLRPSWSSP